MSSQLMTFLTRFLFTASSAAAFRVAFHFFSFPSRNLRRPRAAAALQLPLLSGNKEGKLYNNKLEDEGGGGAFYCALKM